MFQGMHYVYEVYKEMSFSKAARNLFISQPSLSAAVKKAEKQIGFSHFDRSSNHIQLTELGKEYIRSIEIIMDVENGFQNYINDMKELKAVPLPLAALIFCLLCAPASFIPLYRTISPGPGRSGGSYHFPADRPPFLRLLRSAH